MARRFIFSILISALTWTASVEGATSAPASGTAPNPTAAPAPQGITNDRAPEPQLAPLPQRGINDGTATPPGASINGQPAVPEVPSNSSMNPVNNNAAGQPSQINATGTILDVVPTGQPGVSHIRLKDTNGKVTDYELSNGTTFTGVDGNNLKAGDRINVRYGASGTIIDNVSTAP